MTEAEDDGIGIILPPPEIRGIIDKTAKFVAERGGLELEDKIREKERNNPKFSFLNGGDPYYAYYQVKLTEARSGKGKITIKYDI
jgi:splicing factor 3A subunit 1